MIAIIGRTGIAIVAVQIGLWAWLRPDIARLDDRVTTLEVCMSGVEADLRERIARLEGLFERFIRGEPQAVGAVRRHRDGTLRAHRTTRSGSVHMTTLDTAVATIRADLYRALC